MSERLPDVVSVVMPAYNAEPYLAEAAASALSQSWSALELIIVNDGSTDGTQRIADDLARSDARVVVVHQENRGVCAARNAGLAVAKGEWLAFLDSDDLFLGDKLTRQVHFMQQTPGTDLVFSDFYIGDEGGAPIFLERVELPHAPLNELLAYRCWFAPLAPLMRASLVDRIGGFDETLEASEDWDFWIRAARATDFSYLPGPVGVYRIHSAQSHGNRARMKSNQSRVVEKHYRPGMIEWRIARSSMAWAEAQVAWTEGRLPDVAIQLLRVIWRARSVRVASRVRRWASYG